MKKTYTKPNISFESFSLSANIAEECIFEITFAEWECPVYIPEWDETVYQEWNCDWSNDSGFVCYHVPTITTRVFGS